MYIHEVYTTQRALWNAGVVRWYDQFVIETA